MSMPNRNEYGILVQVGSQYQVFDRSGGLPFNLVFNIHRIYNRADADTDPRPILFDTYGSVFDVPFALGNGLLQICKHPHGEALDTSCLAGEHADPQYIALGPVDSSSSANKVTRWGEWLTFLYHVDPDSTLARMLQPETKYKLDFVGKMLGIRWWAFGDIFGLLIDGKPQIPSETGILVKRRHGGNAQFLVKDGVPMPPRVDTSLRLLPSTPGAATRCVIETRLFNTSDRPLTFQTSGHQYYAVPRNTWNEPPPTLDTWRTRIGSHDEMQGRKSFIIRSSETGEKVFFNWKPLPYGSHRGFDSPKRSLVTTVGPAGTGPLANRYDMTDIIEGLPNGDYHIQIEPLGAWWALGTADDIFSDEDRVPRRLTWPPVVPLELASGDTVTVRVADGKYYEQQ